LPDVLTNEQKELTKRIKIKLRQKSGNELLPARTGTALAEYKSQLLRWLQE
jgi:hypothetical protein